MRRLWVLAVVFLTACQPQDPTGASARAPADAPAPPDFSQPMTAIGTEPFWALGVSGTQFKLSRPDEPDLIAQAPGASIRSGQATWTAREAGGRNLTVTFFVSPCSDGMSDRTYPMTAEVTLDGSPTLRGCAIKTAEMPSERGATAGR